jgi:predicted RNA-binding protein with PIN domain
MFLIDGHNLIPKLGLRLDSFDDEDALVSRLQEFSRLRRTQVEVYFDGAPPGQPVRRKIGTVTAHFVRQGSSADAAIEQRLLKMGRSARNWTVVSSDRRVQNAARAVHAQVTSSEEFAIQMRDAQRVRRVKAKRDATVSPDEVDEWLSLFKHHKG